VKLSKTSHPTSDERKVESVESFRTRVAFMIWPWKTENSEACWGGLHPKEPAVGYSPRCSAMTLEAMSCFHK